MTSIHHTCRLRHLAPLAVVFATTAAQAHVSYSGRNFTEKYQSINQPLSRTAYEKKAELLTAQTAAAAEAASKDAPAEAAPTAK